MTTAIDHDLRSLLLALAADPPDMNAMGPLADLLEERGDLRAGEVAVIRRSRIVEVRVRSVHQSPCNVEVILDSDAPRQSKRIALFRISSADQRTAIQHLWMAPGDSISCCSFAVDGIPGEANNGGIDWTIHDMPNTAAEFARTVLALFHEFTP